MSVAELEDALDDEQGFDPKVLSSARKPHA